MATNPKLPPDERLRDDHTRIALTRKPPRWWPPVLIVIAAAVLIGLIVWVATSKPRATQLGPAQPVSALQVTLTNLVVSMPAPSATKDLTGDIVNHGTKPVAGVKVEATFRNATGQSLETVTEQLNSATGGAQNGGFAENPIAPGATAAFVVHLQHVPEGWDARVPDLRITEVRSAAK
jgi:hypothetical protein